MGQIPRSIERISSSSSNVQYKLKLLNLTDAETWIERNTVPSQWRNDKHRRIQI